MLVVAGFSTTWLDAALAEGLSVYAAEHTDLEVQHRALAEGKQKGI